MKDEIIEVLKECYIFNLLDFAETIHHNKMLDLAIEIIEGAE